MFPDFRRGNTLPPTKRPAMRIAGLFIALRFFFLRQSFDFAQDLVSSSHPFDEFYPEPVEWAQG